MKSYLPSLSFSKEAKRAFLLVFFNHYKTTNTIINIPHKFNIKSSVAPTSYHIKEKQIEYLNIKIYNIIATKH